MRRIAAVGIFASLCLGSAHATTFYAGFNVPVGSTGFHGPLPGVSHLRVVLSSSTPFTKGGCTSSATLWDFNDGVNTPQTLVQAGYTTFQSSVDICRASNGAVTQAQVYFIYYSGAGGNYNAASSLMPGQSVYNVVNVEMDGYIAGQSGSQLTPDWKFWSHQ